jgi:formylglycine-generating enzyme required for sulfatase activity
MRRKGQRIALVTSATGLIVLGLAVYLAWPHLLFWYRFAPLGLNAQGYHEYRHRQTGIVFVRLPGGAFWMGAQKTDPKGQNYDPEAQDNEGPVHEVTLSPFLIGKYEVTQGQWLYAMGMGDPARYWLNQDSELPVESVSSDDVQTFCDKVGFRLPSEAQWEYACRGGTSTPFSGNGNLYDMGWYAGNSGGTMPVGKKLANGFGLYDMHGNVMELCEDDYNDGFYSQPRAEGINPVSAEGPGVRVIRGGSFIHIPEGCRSTFRRWSSGLQTLELGFRPAHRLP